MYLIHMYTCMFVCMFMYDQKMHHLCISMSEYVSVIYVLQGGTKDSVTALWLMYYLNYFYFSWPGYLFWYYMLTFFWSLILEAAFCDSGDAHETESFLQTRDGQKILGVGILSWVDPIGSHSVTISSLLWYSSILSGNRCWTQREIKFWIERLIIIGFRGLSFNT